ncbi:hypothetical protein DSM25558_3910 [Agrobacterium sp. DSM 25558]|uniref:hypothetical protein n=1 Tax=Agrobacterium sp. DSM 25558 TaxID=1907665 RepID=UPI0009725FFD|nr:hypothetical protein [Agrobacterium sp. DSM 25558]SCX26009.1 hypothetical protein DSM25558_3910 [Agrobacterium sp. DSM 25558]
MTAYHNESSHYHAQWLRSLISANLIAPGDVDERSIADVYSDDLKPSSHFFAGIGGWSRTLGLARLVDVEIASQCLNETRSAS